MERPTAYVILNTEAHTYVVCPYCHNLHKHGLVITKNESRESGCYKGEYILHELIPSDLYKSIQTRTKALDRNKKRRQIEKEKSKSNVECPKSSST